MIEFENLKNSNKPYIKDLEKAAIKVINSGWYILGNEVREFEAEFARYLGVKYCIGVASGLDALILSIEALSIPKNSDILVASNTYIATILAIIKAGHNPVLVEPDKKTFNIDPKELDKSITSKTKAICITHLYGKCCRMDEINLFADNHNLEIIEDCAQAHGAKFKDQLAGTFGKAGCFSFYPTKNLGGLGDAGAIATDDENLYDKLLHLRNYGSKVKYKNEYLGSNSRLDEIQAAFLRVKLKHLNSLIEHKRILAEIYFKSLPNWLELPIKNVDEFDVFHIFCVRHNNRDSLIKWLSKNGIKTNIHYPIPPHKQKALENIIPQDWPISELIHKTCFSLPISIGTSKKDVKTICEVLNKAKSYI